jgi:hypothetical protein
MKEIFFAPSNSFLGTFVLLIVFGTVKNNRINAIAKIAER